MDAKVLVNAVTGEVESQYVKCPVTRLTKSNGSLYSLCKNLNRMLQLIAFATPLKPPHNQLLPSNRLALQFFCLAQKCP